MKTKKCPMCSAEARIQLESYESGKISARTGIQIIVPDVKIVYCTNSECGHSWLPNEEEERIDLLIERESRFHLDHEQLVKCRKALGFETKTAAANFLCLNTKAFVKWENGTTGPNPAYDLLIRLAVFDRRNFAFIKYLHETHFKFDSRDYQLICEAEATKWKFKTLVSEDPFGSATLHSNERTNQFETFIIRTQEPGNRNQDLNATILYSNKRTHRYEAKELIDLIQSAHSKEQAAKNGSYKLAKVG